MTKREQWITVCLVWAAIWAVLGLVSFPLWLLTVVSLLMIMLPVGVPNNPEEQRYTRRHDPQKWKQR